MIESALVAVAAALEVLARLKVVMPTVPPEILRFARLALPVPVLAELLTFMFSVVIVTDPPLMLVVVWTGDAVWAVEPPPIELLPIPKVLMVTVPPPMLRLATVAPFVVAKVPEFTPAVSVVILTVPVPPEAIRFNVPVIEAVL